MKNVKVFTMVAISLLVGAGLVFLVIRYLDKLTDLIQSVRKHGFFRLEFNAPDSAGISQAAAEDYYQAFQANCATETNPQGEPIPNTPTEE